MRRLGQDGVTPTDRKVALISLDSFYKVLTPEESKAAYAGEYNFDRPGTPSPPLPGVRPPARR